MQVLMHNGWGLTQSSALWEDGVEPERVADCFLLSPSALGSVVMRCSACRSTVLCHASCYDLHELHRVYEQPLSPRESWFITH